MSLPDIIRFVKSANNRCNFCFKIVVQVSVFFNGVSKWKCVQILCSATLHFSYKRARKFLNVFTLQPYYGKCVSKLWCKLPCFCNCDSKEKCVQIFLPCNFALFRQECSQVFERACFLQPYYEKRCCEICYLLPKI